MDWKMKNKREKAKKESSDHYKCWKQLVAMCVLM